MRRLRMLAALILVLAAAGCDRCSCYSNGTVHDATPENYHACRATCQSFAM